MAAWIDFRELRQKLRFADVLRHYNVQAKVKGDRAAALCPLPGHPPRTDGKKRTASLSVNLTKNCFQCFGCKTTGNAVEFVSRMEGFNPEDPVQFRHAALKACEIFGIVTGPAPKRDANDDSPVAPPTVRSTPVEKPAAPKPANVQVNTPLEFELKHLDPKHAYLPGRGFSAETIDRFGLGFCSRGMMAGRIAIPVHNGAGELVGYAGRLVDDHLVNDDRPKYLFPGPREREGKRLEFHKSELLYNANRIEKPVSDLVIVEGFTSVWWLWQHGYKAAVALMGSSCSSEQAKLIVDLVDPHGRVWLMPDGDDAAIQCAKSVLEQVSPHRFTRWIRLAANGQPTDLSPDELDGFLTPKK